VKEGNGKFFKLNLVGNRNEIALNKDGKYLVWKLPSSEIQSGRDRAVGLLWKDDGGMKLFFVEIENFNVER
jgi:hypothetical protein